MGTHNICLYKEVDKKYTGCNQMTMELFDCVLIGECVVNRLNAINIFFQFKELLYDLLAHQDGPRVRDRISHGEADWDRFPRELTDLLLIVSVYLTQLFTSQDINSLSVSNPE